MGDCEQYFALHEDTLKRHDDELKSLAGVPQDLKSIFAILKEIKDTNVSKEVVDLKMQAMESRMKLWMVVSAISGLSSGLLLLAQLYQLLNK
jgi:hypothetical protein